MGNKTITKSADQATGKAEKKTRFWNPFSSKSKNAAIIYLDDLEPVWLRKRKVRTDGYDSPPDPFAQIPRRPVLTSTAFAETRFAKAFEDWENTIQKELAEYAEQVKMDSERGFTWTLFAKIRRPFKRETGKQHGWLDLVEVPPPETPRRMRVETPRSDGRFLIENDDTLISKIIFRLHPTFKPNVIEQTSPVLSRVGWGSFTCQVEMHIKLKRGQICALKFEHDIELHENNTGISASLYCIKIHREKFIIQIGNTFGRIDNPNSDDEYFRKIVTERAERVNQLEKTQKRLSEVRTSQQTIDDFINSCEKKRMGLGAVIAAILNGKKLDTETFEQLYNHGKRSLRCVVLDNETIPQFERFMLGGVALGVEMEAYDISQDATDLLIDRFVSHSWFDDAVKKCNTILNWAKDFQSQHGRPPRIWCDKFCLKQTSDELNMSIPCLPIYLLSCERMLLLKTKTFLTRLWCLTEVYTNFQMGLTSESDNMMDVIHLEDEKTDVLVSVAAAKCSFQEDEDALRQNFDRAPGGTIQVENALNNALGFKS
jgi:hypothetical protein